jgi:hypothetical protein
MDFAALNRGEKIAGIAGLALIVIEFLAWWGGPSVSATVNGITVANFQGGSFSAWEAADFMDVIWFITGLSGIALALLAASDYDVGVPVAMSAVTTLLGALSTLLIVYRLIDPPYDLTRKYGVFLGLIAAAGVAFGGWLAMQEEGTSFAGEADRFRGGGSGGAGTGGTGAGAPPPPPPPPSPSQPASTPTPPPSGGPPPASGQ